MAVAVVDVGAVVRLPVGIGTMRVKAHELWSDVDADGTMYIGVLLPGMEHPAIAIEVLPHGGVIEGQIRLRHLQNRIDRSLAYSERPNKETR